jgi:hypothetical protein
MVEIKTCAQARAYLKKRNLEYNGPEPSKKLPNLWIVIMWGKPDRPFANIPEWVEHGRTFEEALLKTAYKAQGYKFPRRNRSGIFYR